MIRIIAIATLLNFFSFSESHAQNFEKLNSASSKPTTQCQSEAKGSFKEHACSLIARELKASDCVKPVLDELGSIDVGNLKGIPSECNSWIKDPKKRVAFWQEYLGNYINSQTGWDARNQINSDKGPLTAGLFGIYHQSLTVNGKPNGRYACACRDVADDVKKLGTTENNIRCGTYAHLVDLAAYAKGPNGGAAVPSLPKNYELKIRAKMRQFCEGDSKPMRKTENLTEPAAAVPESNGG